MPRILIVEDNFILALALEKQLQRMGLEVMDKIDRGDVAVEKVREDEPDLILMDIKLAGDLDGVDATKKIRDFSDVPVIYLTGTGSAEIERDEKIRETRPSGYLIKPVEPDLLKREIRKVLQWRVPGE